MRTFKNEILLKLAAGVMFFAACVPAQKLSDMTARKDKCEENLSSLRSENLELTTKNTELSKYNDELKKSKAALENDTAEGGIAYRRLTSVYKELSESYDK